MWHQMKFGSNKDLYGIEEKGTENESLIITLPGLGQAMSEKNYLFSNLRKFLAQENKWVVQFDYRGFGDSIGELGEASISTMIEDTMEVLNTVTRSSKPRKIYLIGNALGAIVALEVAIKLRIDKRVKCIPILISPPLQKHPSITEIFSAEVLYKLKKDKYLDSQLLVPGYDYYTLSDFNEEQYNFFISFGAHMLYLHGQCISYTMLEQLEKIDTLALIKKIENLYIIIGEKDKESYELVKKSTQTKVYQLKDVLYYYEHPAAMDKLIILLRNIINNTANSNQ